MIRISVCLAGLSLFLLAGNPGAQEPERIAVLILFHTPPGPSDIALVNATGGQLRFKYDVVPAVAASLPARAISALSANPRVAMIEPDHEYSVNDLQTELDWTWGVRHLGAGTVHANVPSHTGAGVKVAVLDTGINYNHVDLAPNFRGGYDFVNNDTDPWDDHGHGTHVAGTIAAIRDGNGVVGVAPDVSLYALKVLNSSGNGAVSAFIAAIDWAVKNGIQVTNNSYGGLYASATFEQALANAAAAGMLHVGSAGNRGSCEGTGDNVGYPAAYRTVIAVAATDNTDTRACFSSTGPSVELAAPGVQIRSTLRTGSYGDKWNGTSMAAPHVAGAAALLFGSGIVDSNANGRVNDEIRNVLAQSSIDLGSTGRDHHYGLGRVDAAAAVAAAASPILLRSAIERVNYVAAGGKGNRDLSVEIWTNYGIVSPLGGATVSATINKDGVPYAYLNGTTTANGTVAVTLKNAAPGTYTTTVTVLTAQGLTWDGATPANSHVK